MKSISAASLFWLLAAGLPAGAANPDQAILGTWHYAGFEYQNHFYANPNPKLTVQFDFNSDHTSRLYWHRADESAFCERRGTWNLQGDELIQTVTWLNPANDSSCGQDSDMQMNRTTDNRISFTANQLDLHMSLDGEDFIYILAR